MADKKRTETQREIDRRWVSELRARGYTADGVKEEFDKLGRPYTLTRNQLYLDWKECVKEWRESTVASVEQWTRRELKGLEMQERELWKAWEKSKGVLEKRRKESAENEFGPRNKNVVTEEEKVANATFQIAILGVRDRRCKLLGLYKESMEISGPNGGPVEVRGLIEVADISIQDITATLREAESVHEIAMQ